MYEVHEMKMKKQYQSQSRMKKNAKKSHIIRPIITRITESSQRPLLAFSKHQKRYSSTPYPSQSKNRDKKRFKNKSSYILLRCKTQDIYIPITVWLNLGSIKGGGGVWLPYIPFDTSIIIPRALYNKYSILYHTHQKKNKSKNIYLPKRLERKKGKKKEMITS